MTVTLHEDMSLISS